jgi:hypothetical protein
MRIAYFGVEQRVRGEVRRTSETEAERQGGLSTLQHRSSLTKKRDGEPKRDGLVKWRRPPEQAEEALKRERVAAVGGSR